MRKNSAWWWVSIGLALGTFAFGVSRIPSQQYEIARAATLPAPHLPARPIVFTPEDPESLIAAEPSAEVPTLVEASDEQIEIRVKALAHELTHMWTRNPEELVVVIDDAARSMPSAPSVTLLLAIAHAETNGKILDVSEAGAVGLAQATPVAYRQEKFDGKLFVTKDYLVGSRAELRTFRNDVRKEYRALKATQLATWARYQKDLIAKRDRVLEKHFQMKAAKVKKEMAYEASEYLGEHLDDRFSAKSMAKFLVRHLDRKTAEARKLAESEDDVEAMTAALYNGGSHNVKRMLAGLIRSLPETEKYMRKVPATRRRLDGVIAGEMRTLR